MAPPSVLAGLATLEPVEREALLLIYYEQQTQAQIATALDVEPATVAQAVSRAMRRLAAFLAESPDEESDGEPSTLIRRAEGRR